MKIAKAISCFIIILMTQCVARSSGGSSMAMLALLLGSSSNAPVLDSPIISASDTSSITLARPVLINPGNPPASVAAYIGLDGVISISGSTVSSSIQGPIDVSSGPYTFSGLNGGTVYRIVVIARNDAGYFVQQITQSTGSLAPVLNSLAIGASDSSSITLSQPTFASAGNPLPVVNAYIGINGTISVAGSVVSGSLAGPFDVSAGSKQFSGLNANTTYRIIVVAQNVHGYSVKQIAQSTAGIAPVLNSISIGSSDSSSITLTQPTFATAGNPSPSVLAYIGINGSISVTGSNISGASQGPVSVAGGGYQFSGLSPNTTYRVIVVAENSAGYSVQQILQSTAGIAPVLNSLSISSTDASSITISQPTFATSGNPSPTVQAYIGLSGTISVTGSTISGSAQGPINVATGGYQFSSLNSYTSYKIIVVAQNSAGYSVQQITQSTAGIAPVLNSLSISVSDSSSVTLSQPTFSTAGNPSPNVQAYIGLNGTISVSGSTVSNSLQGPVSVATGGYQFSSLSANTQYRIIVVSQNVAGYSTQQIVQSTAGIAPVLNSLSIGSTDSSSITLSQPTFATAGNPSPTVEAYIGLNGTISVTGSTVSASLQGPIDVATGGHQFSGLSSNTSYRIIVVAQNSAGYYVQQIAQSTDGIAPILSSLSISASDSSSITLSQPTLSTAGNPSPTISAYIGLTGTISATGATISNSIQGPIDVSSGGYQFSGLGAYTAFTIIVVAQNAAGYSVQQINQSTAAIAPSLKSLKILPATGAITLLQPTFTTAGNPSPSVSAYIGVSGTISVSGSTVSNSLEGPVNVSTGGYQFSGLSSGINYQVIVVAQNAAGYSVQTVTGTTATTTSSRVYGQLGSFTTGSVNNGGISTNSLNTPYGAAVDSSGNLYIADSGNHRVLYYPAGGTTATRVYGQAGSFTTATANNGGISANSLSTPMQPALDSSGNLYVADRMNNRVLYYPAGSTTATRVYGQAGSFTTNSANNGGVSANSLSSPMGIVVDSSGNLYVADSTNNRVLFYSSGSTTATRVYGQAGSYVTNTSNKGGLSADSLSQPYQLSIDSDGNLYVADFSNNRVLFFASGSTTATRVYGQTGSFTTSTTNKGGISANSLYDPIGLSSDAGGNLYVADYGNSRVLFYSSGSTTATRVYGQGGNFTTNIGNYAGINANSLFYVFSVATDPSGNLYAIDVGNNRVLFYP